MHGGFRTQVIRDTLVGDHARDELAATSKHRAKLREQLTAQDTSRPSAEACPRHTSCR